MNYGMSYNEEKGPEKTGDIWAFKKSLDAAFQSLYMPVLQTGSSEIHWQSEYLTPHLCFFQAELLMGSYCHQLLCSSDKQEAWLDLKVPTS